MKNTAYIRTPPDSIEFSLPYSDGSGERLKVSICKKMLDVSIETTDIILVSVEDIDWLRQALDDIKEVVMLNKEQKAQASVATEAK